MHLFKHYLITAKDFLPDIDNTIQESIFKGVDSLINLCCPTICCNTNSEIGLFDKMPVNAVGGVL